MKFTLIPTLETLQALYRMPLGPARFQAYLKAVVGDAQCTADLRLAPLVHANPMAKAHALECVERWIALEAESHA